MKCLKFLKPLLVAICTVLVPVRAEPKPLDLSPALQSVQMPSKKWIALSPIPILDTQLFCTPVQRYLCCNGLPFGFIDDIKDLICQGVRESGCDDGTRDLCSANTVLSFLFLKVPLALLSYIKNVICCNDLNKEIIASLQNAFCTNVVNVLCCKGVNILDINSVKDGFCDPCYRYCKNNGTCSHDKVKNETTCTCIDPYFGERCELKCCEEQEYQWIYASNGAKPDNAINGCYNGVCDVYVARAIYTPLFKPTAGKLIPEDKGTYIGIEDKPNNFNTYFRTEYQVLNGTQDNMVWVKAEGDGKVAPRCAVENINFGPYGTSYVGRARLNRTDTNGSTGQILFGKINFAYDPTHAYHYGVSDGFDYLTCRVKTM